MRRIVLGRRYKRPTCTRVAWWQRGRLFGYMVKLYILPSSVMPGEQH
jgi:hypothetical protein